jgi:8-oxo-dGTP pyrophosphatase MutT (NUDIX family)
MSIYNHNIYDNVRTRVIVLHQGCMLLHPPQETGSGWRPPGGGLEPQESLAECAIREVFEETGIHIRVSGIAFLREWVVPKYCPMPDGKEEVGFGLEVYLYGHPAGEPSAPRAERADLPAPCWIRLEEVPNLPLWPKEMKALASALLSGPTVYGVPSFVSQLVSPWEMPSEPVVFNLRVKTRD